MRIAVVGGGPAGLAAAWTAASRGAEVDVYERSERPGGLLRTELLAGARVDTGVQLVASAHSALIGLLREAGLAGLLTPSAGRDALWRRGRPQPITYGSVASMVSSSALPMTLKLKMGARYLPFLKTEARRLDANDVLASGGAEFDSESVAAWGSRELGDDFTELLAYPLLAAYYGATPEETSAAVYHALARVGLDVRVLAAAGGFGAVAAGLSESLEARGVRLHTRRAVQGVRIGADGAEVDGERFDAAVLAVPARGAAALLSAQGALQEWLARVRERTTFTVAYRLDRRFPGDYFGLSFPRGGEHGDVLAALCIQSAKAGSQLAEGDAITVMPAPAVVERLLALDDDGVTERVLGAVERAVPGITKRVTASHVTRFEDGYSIFYPGYVRHLRALDASWLPPRLALAGDYLVAPSVEGAVRSGIRAAERVLETLRA
jgi:protoporphyrinogen/coproporphyrinogen III oxidase